MSTLHSVGRKISYMLHPQPHGMLSKHHCTITSCDHILMLFYANGNTIQWSLSIMVTVLAGHPLYNSQGSRFQNVHFNLC